MPIFNYKAVDKFGLVKEGSINASSEQDVANSLKSQELIVVKIRSGGDEWKGTKIFSRRKISRLDLATFMDNLATMIKAGLTLLDAISVIKDDTKNPKLKEVLTDIERSLESGIPISDALLKYPDIFDGSIISLIKAGELSGQLEEALSNLAFKLKQDLDLSRKIRASLAYPLVICSILVLMASGIAIFVLPKLADAFSRMTVKVPLGIKIIVVSGSFLRHYWYLVIIGLVLIIWLIIQFFKSRFGKKIVNKTAMKIPLIKEIVLDIDLARYSYSLSMLLKSGVPMPEALHIASAAIYNDDLRKEALKFEDYITSGITLTNAFRKSESMFPSFMRQMVDTGEKTGHLDEAFLKLGNFYNEETNIKLQTMTTIIEPILMLVIGLLTALFIIAILLPVYQLVGSFSAQ